VQYSKVIAAFFLLTIYMLSATASREILKLPLLAEHFYDHIEENRNTGLISFLVMHYYTEDGTDVDADEDNQLPFKSAEYPVSFSFISLTPPSITASLSKPDSENNQSFGMHTELFIPSQYLAAIWQPPRYC
jgi:hypothetical protein